MTTNQNSTNTTPYVSKLPDGVISLINAQGKYPQLEVNGPEGDPMKVYAVGYNPKTGAIYFANTDPRNRNRYVNNSTDRQAERAGDEKLRTTAQYIANTGADTHVLTVAGMENKSREQVLEYLQKQQGNIRLNQMHILAPQQTDQAQVRSENDKKNFWDREFLGLSARAWAWIIGGLLLGGLAYGAFRKGGWLNKRKNKSTPSSITPTPTGPGQTPTGPGQTPTEPGQTPTGPGQTPTIPTFVDTPSAGTTTTPPATTPSTTPSPIGTVITNPGSITTIDYGGRGRRSI